MTEYEKQVKIEHRKLALLHAVFFLISGTFACLALITPIVSFLIAVYVADIGFTWRLLGAGISLLYLAVMFGLYVIFSQLASRFEDTFMIIPVYPYDCIGKYYSEILAERKMKEKGILK